MSDDLVGTVTRLKEQDGKDIIAYGGATLVQALIANGLLDELHLIVNPTSLGRGLPVFPEGYQRLKLEAATRFECGVAALRYAPA
ncbi:dihydrofolate reductase family protein [Actinokineospora soli]|uniref:Dihydrofolate reductase family protein n=1 Tax=Actinokineospora soli TaxID=1048753 RepID=A0ABW2TVH0_9PSEU